MVIKTKALGLLISVATLVSQAAIAAPAPSGKTTTPTAGKAVAPVKGKHIGISESRALEIVAARAEVKKWKKDVSSAEAKKRGVTAHIALDRVENGEYIIQVYEEVPDGADSGHTATFNWYHVNKRSGAVTTEF